MSLQKIRDMKKEYDKKIKDEGQELILAEIKNIFAEFPRLEAVRWAQYTPHFNDGDVCSFSVHDPEFKISGYELYYPKYTKSYYDSENRRYVNGVRIEGEWAESPDTGESDDGFLNYFPSDDGYKIVNQLTAKERKLLKRLEDVLDTEDVMQAIFGDGYQITIERDGTVIKEEYDHD